MVIFIILMKINSFIFLNKVETSRELLYYFFIQSLGSLILILCSFVSNSMGVYSLTTFIILSIIFKSGIIPFHSWMFKISPNLDNYTFLLLLVIQKIPFIFFIGFNLDSIFIFFLLLNILIGSFYLLKRGKSYINLLVSSSIYRVFWIVSFLLYRFYLFFFFFSFYTIHSLFIIKSLSDFFTFKLKDNLNLIISGLFFIGLPPFRIFFSKFMLGFQIFSGFSLTTSLIIWSGTFLRIVGYFKFFSSFYFVFPFLFSSSFKRPMNYLPIFLFTFLFFL